MRRLWSIDAGNMVDNFVSPENVPDGMWRVGDTGQQWPRFHPSEADPNAGYRPHPFTVSFDLDHDPQGTYVLRLEYLSVAPRLSNLDVAINGHRGRLYLRPTPESGGEIRFPAGLHTSIYTGGSVEAAFPAAFLHCGTNCLTLTAVDDGDFEMVQGWERILRLDRMADSAGFLYDRLEFWEDPARARSPAITFDLIPTALYSRDGSGAMVQHCHLYISVNRPVHGHPITLEMDHVPTTLQVPTMDLGMARLDVPAPDGEGPIAWEIEDLLEPGFGRGGGHAPRPRKWTIYVAPHAHTDIGYTHRQWEVAERHALNIDRAVDLIEAGDFAFHLDSSWPLEHYQATRSADRQRRLQAQIDRGHFGIAASYVDLLTQFAGLEDLIHNGDYADDLLSEMGQGSTFTAVVDVASLTGSFPAILEGQGVRYLVHANNQDRGPFRSHSELHRVSPYYWDGTVGGSVLVWLSKAYCELRKICGSPPTLDSAARGLDQWLQEYERPEYRTDVLLMYGQEADNTELDPQPVSFLDRWNETYAFPRLHPSSVTDFFRDVEARFGADLARVRGDGGAYWEDGVLSSIAPTIAVRSVQASLPAAETLESLAVLLNRDSAFPEGNYRDAWRQVLLYDEHTWGAAMSMTDPDSWMQRDQWAIKEHMARSAAQWSDRLLHGAAVRHSLRWNATGREVVVYNPHSWEISGPAAVEVARGEHPVDSRTGSPAPMRQLGTTATQQQVELWVDRLPGLSFRRFTLEPEPPREANRLQAPVLENAYYRLEVDVEAGCVRRWQDRTLGREMVDGGGPGLGRFLYAEGGEGTRLTNNRTDLPVGNPRLLEEFQLEAWMAEESTYGQTLRMQGTVPAGTLQIEWVLPASARWIDVRYRYEKRPVAGREAAYIAFPLALPHATVLSDSQLGWVNWQEDELPGGAKEWLPLQSSILARGDGVDVLLCSPAIPIFCIGDIVRGRWPRERDLSGGRLYSYLLNNYWHTNYKAQQGGIIEFSYRLMSDTDISLDRAFREGKAARRPIYAHRMGFQAFREPVAPYGGAEGTLARVTPETVSLSTLRPARRGGGWTVRLQETAGRADVAQIRIEGVPIESAWSTDLLGGTLRPLDVGDDGAVTIPVEPWGLASVRLMPAGGTVETVEG